MSTSKAYHLLKNAIKSHDEIEILQAIIEASYDGIYITDGEANTITVNKSFKRITGIDPDEMIGKNVRQIVEEGYFSQSVSLLAIAQRTTVTVRVTIDGKDILSTATPVFENDDVNGEILFVMINVRNIPELVEIRNAIKDEFSHAIAWNEKYRTEPEFKQSGESVFGNMIVKDRVMMDVIEMALRVAKFDSNVLVLGETGVGKGDIAKLIHNNSHRADKSFIEVNCGAIPKELVESEFFGYAKGAFTGASPTGKQGFFNLADGGTIFLDEVSELPLETQVKLLQVLQDKIIYSVGSSTKTNIDVRIIAATNKSLSELVNEGKFRKDLYYRLSVAPIFVPALKDRKDDIIPLVLNFVNRYNERFNTSKFFMPESLNAFTAYNWPGNVRELRNLVERLIIMTRLDKIELADLPPYVRESTHYSAGPGKFRGMELKKATRLFEQEFIRETIASAGSVRKAARALKINPSTITRKLSST